MAAELFTCRFRLRKVTFLVPLTKMAAGWALVVLAVKVTLPPSNTMLSAVAFPGMVVSANVSA